VRRAKTSPEANDAASVVMATPTPGETTPTASAQPPAVASISQRGRRRSAKKYWQIEETADPREAAEAAGELYATNDDQTSAVDDSEHVTSAEFSIDTFHFCLTDHSLYCLLCF